MFSSIAGLLLLGVVLIPGCAYNLTRRRSVPMARTSRSIATFQVIVSAFVFTAASLSIFGALRHLSWVANHSPNPTELIRDPRAFLLADDSRLLWLLAWIAMVTAAAVLLAWIAAHRLWLPERVLKWSDPAIVDASAWHRVFRTKVPDGAEVFVSCELHDGAYVRGRLDWYSAETDETPDREIVLAHPLQVRAADRPDDPPIDMPSQIQRLVISARHIRSLAVIYFKRQPDKPGTGNGAE